MCERAFQRKHGQQKEGLGLNITQPQDQQQIQKSAFLTFDSFHLWINYYNNQSMTAHYKTEPMFQVH